MDKILILPGPDNQAGSEFYFDMTVYRFLINGTCQYVEYLLHKSNIVLNVLLSFLWSVLPRFLLSKCHNRPVNYVT